MTSPFRQPRPTSSLSRSFLPQAPQEGGEQQRAALLALGQRVADDVSRAMAAPDSRLARLERLAQVDRFRPFLSQPERELLHRHLRRLRGEHARVERRPTPDPDGSDAGDAA